MISKWTRKLKWVCLQRVILYSYNSCAILKPVNYHIVSDLNIDICTSHTLSQRGRHTQQFPLTNQKSCARSVSNSLFLFIKCSWFRSIDLLFGPAPQNELMWRSFSWSWMTYPPKINKISARDSNSKHII